MALWANSSWIQFLTWSTCVSASVHYLQTYGLNQHFVNYKFGQNLGGIHTPTNQEVVGPNNFLNMLVATRILDFKKFGSPLFLTI